MVVLLPPSTALMLMCGVTNIRLICQVEARRLLKSAKVQRPESLSAVARTGSGLFAGACLDCQ